MASFLIPIGLFIKTINHSLPGLMQALPIYLFILYVLFKFIQRPKDVLTIPINGRVILVYALLLISQLIMIFYSYSVATRKGVTSGLTTGPLNVFLLLGNFLLIYVLMELSVSTQNDEVKLFKSVFVTFAFLFVLVLLPQIIATFSSVLDSWVNFLGKSFEATHDGRIDFYAKGSYATTLHRVNGFEKEASFLASLLGIVFVPPILASIKNKYNVFNAGKRETKLFWILLVIVFITLFFAKTSTGFVVIGITMIILFTIIPRDFRKQAYLIILFGILFMFILYKTSGYVSFVLNKYLLQKSGTDNRIGGTIALFRTFFHYPLFGVGAGYTSYYNFKFVPDWSTYNYEYQVIFAKSGYPDQSVLGSILASYGLMGLVPMVAYLYHKIKNAMNLKSRYFSAKDDSSLFLKTVIDSFYYYLIFLFILSIFTFSWTDEIYLVMFMFYIHVINRATAVVEG